MATSQNGYPVVFDRTDERLKLWRVPGSKRHFLLRSNALGFVLIYFATWFHEAIMRIDVGTWDDWAWNVRPVRGKTTGYSNHASGTAIDIDALKHVQGRRDTFTDAHERKIRRFLRLVLWGTVRWGGDYTQVVDEMHFEIHRPLRFVKAVAVLLRATPRGRRIVEANRAA